MSQFLSSISWVISSRERQAPQSIHFPLVNPSTVSVLGKTQSHPLLCPCPASRGNWRHELGRGCRVLQ